MNHPSRDVQAWARRAASTTTVLLILLSFAAPGAVAEEAAEPEFGLHLEEFLEIAELAPGAEAVAEIGEEVAGIGQEPVQVD